MKPAWRPATGLTLVELMISLAIGMLIVLASTALLLSSKRSFSAQDDEARLDEVGRFALEVVTRAIRQAGFAGTDRIASEPVRMPAVLGLDASMVERNTPGLESAVATAINNSDVLAVRYFGSGIGKGDGTTLNCAGFSVPGAVDISDDGRSWSIFYVAEDSGGEPQLYCKYAGREGWTSDAVVRGVESLQVLYGVDADEDGLPERMLSATALGPHPEDLGQAQVSAWSKVVSVRVALLLRSDGNGKEGTDNRVYDLFGRSYADLHSDDRGTRLADSDFGAALQRRTRKVVSTTVQLRNPQAGVPH